MKIYIDNDYKCHVTDDGSMTAVETEFFGGKCDEFIEGYRFVPTGESWVRSDDEVFEGEMVAPWKEYDELDEVQRSYEWKLMADMKNALATLGVIVNE